MKNALPRITPKKMKLALFVVGTLALQPAYAQVFQSDSRGEHPSLSRAIHDESSFSLNLSESAFLNDVASGHDAFSTNSAAFGQVSRSLELFPDLSLLETAWRYSLSMITDSREKGEAWTDIPPQSFFDLTPSSEPERGRPALTVAAADRHGDLTFQSVGPVRSFTRYEDRASTVSASNGASWSFGRSATHAGTTSLALLFDPGPLNEFSITRHELGLHLTGEGGGKSMHAMFTPVDVPEPSTYATITASLLVVFTIVRRRMRR